MKKILLFLMLMFIPFCSALTSGEGVILFGSIFSVLTVVVFFLLLSIIIKNTPMKIFFMSLSLLTLVASVGMGVSIMQEFFSSITPITTAYGQFYIMLIILVTTGIALLIVYLAIVAFKSFYSYRGMSNED